MKKISWVSTVVGSFPYENTKENMEHAFWDQIHAGIDYPCYPQLISMIDQFLEPAIEAKTGIYQKGGQFYLDGDFQVPSHPIATEYGQFVLNFFEKYPEAKKKIKGWKACLTGPFTLAGDIIVTPEMVNGKRPILYDEPRAIMNAEIVSKIATMMADIARSYVDMGASIISMDEPSLGLVIGKRKSFFHQDETFTDILNQAIKPITTNSSIHVCGRIAPRLRDILLNTSVNIMDHEFQKCNNDNLLTKDMLESSNKTLAYGITESSTAYQKNGTIESYVESPVIIKDRMLKVIEQFGKENLILKPDCGFGGLLGIFGQEMGSEIVRQKLRILSETMKKF
jgi:methionine synthase II (cobalamin-independent)